MDPEVAQRSEGQARQQSKSSQSNQSNRNPDHQGTGKLVSRRNTKTTQGGEVNSRSQEIIETHCFHESNYSRVEKEIVHEGTERPVMCRDTSYVQRASQACSSHESTNSQVEKEKIHERTGRPMIDRNAHHDPNNEQSMLNEVNIDFRIPELPHSVVKQAESSRVLELVTKIASHPDRHTLQQDLQQDQVYNPFSQKTKNMIKDVGNVELCETQCKACLSYCNEGIVYCTCGHLLKETPDNRKRI